MGNYILLLTRASKVEENVEKSAEIKYYSYNMPAKPFIKWVGGKSQLLDKIKEKYPGEIKGVPAGAVGLFALRCRSFRRDILSLWNFGATIPHAGNV